MVAYTRCPLLAGLLVLAGAAACIPIPNTVTLSPAIEGRYERSDGQPVAGARVVLSTAGADSACANPAASAVTDNQGRFQLPATTRREPVVLLIPNLDRAFCYRICGGASEPLLRSGGRCAVRRVPPNQAVRCVEYPVFQRPDSTRLACYYRVRDTDEP